MRKLSLTQLLKNAVAFATVSAATADVGLLLVDRVELFPVPTSWYVNVPLGVWTLVGIPVSITLAERLLRQTEALRPGRITVASEAGPPSLLRTITWNNPRGSRQLMVQSAPHLLAKPEPGRVSPRSMVWQVPVGENRVLVREMELRAFLEICQKRQEARKATFSRDYWLYDRRPPLWRGKYEAMLTLLTETGLIEGRQGGASGWLVTKPQHAITYLKHESPYGAA